MQNVIQFRGYHKGLPDDLMTLRELEAHGFKYGFLYKWSVGAKRQGKEGIPFYDVGTIKLSLAEVMEFQRKRTEKRYGGDFKKNL